MEMYLLLEFDSGGLFRRITRQGSNYGYKDFIVDVDGLEDGTKNKIERDTLPTFKEPLTVYQISNVLHVLFGERPVPSLRKSNYSRNEYLFEKARNSYLRINTIKDQFGRFPREKFRVKKSVKNSWVREITITWEMIKYYINDNEKYNIYLKFLEEILGFYPMSMTYEKLIDYVRELPLETSRKIFDIIKDLKGCDGLCYGFGLYLKNNIFSIGKIDKSVLVRRYYTNKTELFMTTLRLINFGVEDIAKINGFILVPITNEDITTLKENSTGTAKILDGGLVWIRGIFSGDDIDVTEYTLLDEISTEMVAPIKN